jgi:hypothetical protein
MKGDVVPDDHHVTRLCGGSHIRENGTIAATAFKPRPGETYLSVNWLEVLGLPDRTAEIAEVRRVLGNKRKIGPTARLAVLNVGHVSDVVKRESNNRIELVVRHEPENEPGRPSDPSHSGIYGVPEDDITIPELIIAAIADSR